MKTTTNQTQPTLIAVTSDDMAVVRTIERDIVKTPCLVDNEGRIYYSLKGINCYLPLEFQPRLIHKN